MGHRVTAPKLRLMRDANERIVCLTAYDAPHAKLADEAGVDLILVGDSVANVLLGMSTTIPLSLDAMAHHVRAAKTGVNNALLVADLPFGSYGASVEQAVRSSAFLAQNGAEAVKLEGEYVAEIEAIIKTGVPVMGHVGFTPQSVHNFGGFRVQGRQAEAEQAILATAKRIQDAGAFAIVLELVPGEVAARITSELEIPTIGIGAGIGCSGQIQVMHDLLGYGEKVHKHARQYVDVGSQIRDAFRQYANDVRAGDFPRPENTF